MCVQAFFTENQLSKCLFIQPTRLTVCGLCERVVWETEKTMLCLYRSSLTCSLALASAPENYEANPLQCSENNRKLIVVV